MNDENKIRILSLNGGGARGQFTISVLAELEEIIEIKNNLKGVKIGDYFDLISGTSIGGIIALGLASGKSARELENVIENSAHKIFPKKSGFKKGLLAAFGAKYDSKPLKETILSIISSDIKFNDLNTRVMIPAVNITTGKPQFFKTPHNPSFTRDGRLKLIDAALATSAAPTYFKPHYCEDLKAYFVDGGLVANNPSFVSLHEALKDMKSDFPNSTIHDVHILNVGTMAEEYCISPKRLSKKWNYGYFGLWGLGERLVLSTMTANQILHKSMLERDLRTADIQKNYIYLDSNIPNEAAKEITLDNASKTTISTLKSRGKQLASEECIKKGLLENFFYDKAKKFFIKIR